MYKFDPAGPSVEEAFRAIALSQPDDALSAFRTSGGDGRSVVPEPRLRFQKPRVPLRLMLPAVPTLRRQHPTPATAPARCKPGSGFLPYRWAVYAEAWLLYALGLGSPPFPLPPESYAAWTAI